MITVKFLLIEKFTFDIQLSFVESDKYRVCFQGNFSISDATSACVLSNNQNTRLLGDD